MIHFKIESKQQYHVAMTQLESYLQKDFANLTEEEEMHLGELSKAVEHWELKEYPIPVR